MLLPEPEYPALVRKPHYCLCVARPPTSDQEGVPCVCATRGFGGTPIDLAELCARMKITFIPTPLVAGDIQARHVAINKARGLPEMAAAARGVWKPHPLAVIGAGPSVAEHAEELRDWPGERWAVNNAHRWCREQGIAATFMTGDPGVWDWDFRQGERALVASCCDPALIDALIAARCDIAMFDYASSTGAGGVWSVSTSASAAATLGPIMGYKEVVFFGCDSCYAMGRTHVNEHVALDRWLAVVSDGATYICNPQMLIQAEGLSKIIRLFPHVLKERSGGLLGAMVRSGDYDVMVVSESLTEKLTPVHKMNATLRSHLPLTPHGDPHNET